MIKRTGTRQSKKCSICGEKVSGKHGTHCNKCHNDPDRRMRLDPLGQLWKQFLLGRVG